MWSAPVPLLFSIQLDEARRELKDDVLRGHGGRAALARFSDRLDTIVRQLFAAAPPTPQPVAVVAIGGYGRRQLFLHSDIDLLVLFGGHFGSAEEDALRAILHPAVGSRPGRGTPGARNRGVRQAGGRQSRIPDGTRRRRSTTLRSVRVGLPSCGDAMDRRAHGPVVSPPGCRRTVEHEFIRPKGCGGLPWSPISIGLSFRRASVDAAQGGERST